MNLKEGDAVFAVIKATEVSRRKGIAIPSSLLCRDLALRYPQQRAAERH